MESLQFNWADYVVLLVVSLSIIISLMRGFIKESLSLATWVIAFWVSLTFADNLANMLSVYIETPSLQMGVSFISIFVAVIIIGALVNKLICLMVQKSGLSGTDRMIGMLFGFGRGIVIIALLLLLGNLASLNEDPWWKESKLIGHIEPAAEWLQDFMPENFDSIISPDKS